MTILMNIHIYYIYIYIRRPLLSLGLSGAAPGTAQREAITNDFGRMPAPQPCPAKPVRVMSLIVATCLHRSLACPSRRTSLSKAF